MSSLTKQYSWIKLIPFISMHLGCIAVFFVPFAWKWVILAVILYYVRMFGITAGYHRYFAHKSFKTSRPMQFVFAVLGTLALQKGPLWWPAHHRTHHRYSGLDGDVHSPEKDGFWWAHIGWLLSQKYDETRYDLIKDFGKYPEIQWLNNHYLVPPLTLAALLFIIGGLPAFVWGFVVSTVVGYHCTFFINSLCHMFGRRRFQTEDDSRNSLILALLTMGEGWHNNHHFYQSSARQGLYWWEIDISYAILKTMSWFGLVWDLKKHPDWVKEKKTEKPKFIVPTKFPKHKTVGAIH